MSTSITFTISISITQY